jgi:aromatic-L-amino-acid decarboxylase
MPVVCFRFVAGVADAGLTNANTDKLNSEIVERINASGRAYLTQTKLRGRTVMRIGLGNILTAEGHLRKGWEMIQKIADEL